jgi:arylsulfatase A-like enzyme
VLLIAGIPGITSARYYHLNEHPLVAAIGDWRAESLSGSMARKQWKPAAADSAMAAVDRNPELARLREIGRHRKRRPNVVMVVMESVGALHLLDEAGLPRKLYAPNLARLAQTGVTFDSLYVPFPATTRSLVSLHTGGRQMTEGSIDGLERRYTGPMLGREMQQLGYKTALFSSERLDVENCDVFLRQVGYDRFQDFEQDLAKLDSRNLIHSWGAREEYTLGLMDQWLEDVKGKPFYLEYMTVATHHPYGAPAGYPAPFAGKDAQSQYLNALHYTDRAIGALEALLTQRGLLEDTLILVTGDHGEGFGERHAGNYLHREFVYEENVRGFLTVSDAAWKLAGPVRSGRIASNGDVMATLMDYAGVEDASLPGRSLWAQEFEQRKVFFYKLALPEQWGLRDGNWKYIGEIRSGKAELYDLERDPGERQNLAAAEPARVEQYAALCEEWFVRSDAEYTARLEGYRPVGGRVLRPAEFREAGPKLLSTGVQHGAEFTETAAFRVNDRPVAWTSWVNDGTARHERWRWLSPSGAKFENEVDLHGDWTVSLTPFPGPLPMEVGQWTVELEGTRLKSGFQVGGRP